MINVKNDFASCILGRLTVLEQAENHIYPNEKHCAMRKCECSCDKHNIEL